MGIVVDAELGLTLRSRTLTNSASEFIENRPQEVFGDEADALTGTTFIPELDSFVANEDAAQPDYYAQSEARLTEFKKTLSGFTAMIKERKLDKKLDIELKSPDKYTMDDVVLIASKMEQRHEDVAKVKSCMGVIRKVFRKAGDNKSTLKKLLSFVPNDTYGTILLGGFTIILGAIDRADGLRREIATAVAAIPQKLEHTKVLLGVYKSPKLHFSADSVFLAVFSLLNCIVKELDKNLAKKGFSATLKGDRYGHEISDAIENLDTALAEFKAEAELCAAQRLGRIEKHAIGGRMDIANVQRMLGDMEKREEEKAQQTKEWQQAVIQEFGNQGRLLIERMEETERHRQTSASGANVTTNYYVFLTSSPYFDPRTGTLDEYQAEAHRRLGAPAGAGLQALRAPSPALSVRSFSSIRSVSDAHGLVQEIFKGLDLSSPWRDVEECLDNFERFSGAEKDQARYILVSEEVQDWLREDERRVLVVEPENAPDEILNPLTFAAAFLAKSFKANKSKPTVLCFHCGLRANDSIDEKQSGPLAMLNSLNAQLLTQTLQAKGDVSIPILEDPTQRKKVRKRIPKALRLFRQTLDAFSAQDPIFIIIDALSRMPGSHEQREAVMEGVLSVVEDVDATVKLVVTDMCSLKGVVEEREFIELYVEEYVDGWKQDMSVEHLDEDTRLSKTELRSKRAPYESESDEDSDSDGDSN
ncbi:Fc.00g014000.m01.CDS01 [Cosmosporella sp. VM-42]